MGYGISNDGKKFLDYQELLGVKDGVNQDILTRGTSLCGISKYGAYPSLLVVNTSFF